MRYKGYVVTYAGGLLKVNKVNIKQIYLNQLINSPTKKENTQIKINPNKIIFPTETTTDIPLGTTLNVVVLYAL